MVSSDYDHLFDVVGSENCVAVMLFTVKVEYPEFDPLGVGLFTLDYFYSL
jgi:hypothetical protein